MHIFVTLIKESIDLRGSGGGMGGIGGKKGKGRSDIFIISWKLENFSINKKKFRWLIHAMGKVIPKIPALFFFLVTWLNF